MSAPSLWRAALAVGPIVFLGLLVVRAVTPVVDPTLLSISLVIAIATAGTVAGWRWAALAYLLVPVALLTSPAGRELSFDLSAVDSSGWRWFAVGSLLSVGVATAVAILVLVGRQPSPSTGAATIVGGLALGAVMIVGIQALEPHPAFGDDLGDEEVAALPVIELVNYGYLADGPITVPSDATFRARLDNPSDLPHTFTVEELDVEVYVPAGRWAIVELDGTLLVGDDVEIICTVGDHLEQGMQIRAAVS